MSLNQGQQAVLDSAMKFVTSKSEQFMVIKGKPGTGKSYLTKAIIEGIEKYMTIINNLMANPSDTEIYITTTTNAACAVLAKVTGKDTQTIHSLIGLTLRVDYKTGEEKLTRKADSDVIKNAIILIDEAFSINDQLLEYINKCTVNCKIIFIGDPYQTAPVKCKRSPVDLLICRTEELTQPMRNQGVLDMFSDHWRNSVITETFSPFLLQDPSIEWVNGSDFSALIDDAFKDPNCLAGKNKILTWTNNRADSYCQYVRALWGLSAEYTAGEYVQVINGLPKQELYVDQIIKINSFSNLISKVHGIEGRYATIENKLHQLFIPISTTDVLKRLKETAAIKDWTPHYEIKQSIPLLRPVHGSTIHKAQGSTYETVFVDLPDVGACNIASDVARMMTVAVSRPTTRLILRGKLPEKYGG